MAPVFEISTDLLDDCHCQTLKSADFKRLFLAAVAGADNEFSRFIRKARLRPNASEWAQARSAVFERDDYTCQYCGVRGGRLECDHVIPVCRGGSNDYTNLVTACFRCNRSKHSKTVEEWLQ